jgi:hypothetical protein
MMSRGCVKNLANMVPATLALKMPHSAMVCVPAAQLRLFQVSVKLFVVTEDTDWTLEEAISAWS